jgi:hypothetical protein
MHTGRRETDAKLKCQIKRDEINSASLVVKSKLSFERERVLPCLPTGDDNRSSGWYEYKIPKIPEEIRRDPKKKPEEALRGIRRIRTTCPHQLVARRTATNRVANAAHKS